MSDSTTISYSIITIVTAIGSVGTAVSVLWAIFVYRKNNDEKSFSKTREVLSALMDKISGLDGLLSEPEFSVLGNFISEQIMRLKPKEMTFSEFTDYLRDTENDIHIAQAVHVGRQNCDYVEKIENYVSGIRKIPALLIEKLPVVSLAIARVLFYITKPGESTMAPVVLFQIFGEESNRGNLMEKLQKCKNENIYRSELSLFISGLPSYLMIQKKLGQETFDKAEKFIHIVVNTFLRLDNKKIKKSSKLQLRIYSELFSIDKEHAIEDAIEMLKPIKSEFSDQDWATLNSLKGEVVTLMRQS